MTTPVVRFERVSRTFGDLLAVNEATLDVVAGEVLAILGENGAGKSTLMKLLYGIHPPTAGEILIDGRRSAIGGPAEAMHNGIGMVFQNFSQLPALSVRDNLLLAWPQTPYWKSRRNPATAPALDILSRLAPQIDPNSLVRDLSVGEQQIVELCKVLNISARVVILDEPTSVLTPAEAERLHAFIRQLATDGMAVVLITHKLVDVEACADRIAVMRRGAIVDISRQGERSMADIVSLMMGKEITRHLSPPPAPDTREPRLSLDGVCAEAPGVRLEGISLSVRPGEILGIAGVAGNGQGLFAEVVAGIRPIDSGDIRLDGVSIARRSHYERVCTPIGYIPEQPRHNAVVETMRLIENLRLRDLAAGTPISNRKSDDLVRFMVNPAEPERQAGTLSGGNLQKLVIARELGSPRPAVLACYPTMGLDFSAIELVYAEMFAQAAAGAAVLWVSEDLDDLFAAAHRIAVIREGKIVADLNNDGTLTRDRIGALMTGMREQAA